MKNEQLDALFTNYAWRQTPCLLKMCGASIESRRILLPLPPSDNDRLSCSRGRIISSEHYRKWSHRAQNMLAKFKLEMFAPELTTALHAFTIVVLQNRKSDIHNYEKSLFDAIEKSERVYANDRQIMERHTTGVISPNAPCSYVVCYISKLSDMPSVRDYLATEQHINELNQYISQGYDEPGQKICTATRPVI